MKPTEATLPQGPYLGHFKNGVIVLDADVMLNEGQAVRIEPLALKGESLDNDERADQLRRMQELFAQWDKEDEQISDEADESFHQALQQNRGISFRTANLG